MNRPKTTISEATTLGELSAALRERQLSATIYTLRDDSYVVWMFAADDPALGIFPGEGAELEIALKAALDEWDEADIAESVVSVPEKGPPS